MDNPLDAKKHVQAMLAKGWLWSEFENDVLVHPQDHRLAVRFNRAANTLSMSPALAKAIELVIPTPRGKSSSFWRS
jgi:hypothetical protein